MFSTVVVVAVIGVASSFDYPGSALAALVRASASLDRAAARGRTLDAPSGFLDGNAGDRVLDSGRMDALSESLRAIRLDSAIYINAEVSAPCCLASPESRRLPPLIAPLR